MSDPSASTESGSPPAEASSGSGEESRGNVFLSAGADRRCAHRHGDRTGHRHGHRQCRKKTDGPLVSSLLKARPHIVSTSLWEKLVGEDRGQPLLIPFAGPASVAHE